MKTYNTVITSKEVKTLENVEAAESITLPEPPKEIDITDVLDEPEAKQESDRIAFAKASKAFIQEWRANNPYPGSDHLDEFNAKFNRDYSAFANKYGVSGVRPRKKGGGYIGGIH